MSGAHADAPRLGEGMGRRLGRWLAAGARPAASPQRRPVSAPTIDLEEGWGLLVALVVMAAMAFAIGFFGLTAFVAAGSAMERPAAHSELQR